MGYGQKIKSCPANIIFPHANKVLAADKNLVYFCDRSTRIIIKRASLVLK